MVIRDDFDKSNVDLKNWKQDVYEDIQRFISENKSSADSFKNDNSFKVNSVVDIQKEIAREVNSVKAKQ
jgi:hypothetical protein